MRDLVSVLLHEYDALRQAATTGKPSYPVTRFGNLDELLGGGLRQGVNILQAAPGAGKTAMGLQIAATCGYPAIYVSAEMAPVQLFRRIVARQTATPLSTLNGAQLERDGLRKLAWQTANAVQHLWIVDATVHAAPSNLFDEWSTELEQESGSRPLVVVDSIQSWAKATLINRPYTTDYEIITRAVRELVEIASRLSVPLLGIAQRHRAGQERGGLHASKGTGDIEYCAEAVLELRTEPEARADAAGEVQVEVVVLKNRNGLAGATVALLFNGSRQSFRCPDTGGRRR